MYFIEEIKESKIFSDIILRNKKKKNILSNLNNAINQLV